ncbi:MAG: Asp23/Gls24 family envelope stress response protein [Rubrobacter sp.]|jgi:uncharacterized alkaline shock family protein YloU
MSQSEQQHDQSPLLSDRGTTIISDTVVSSLAGMAAREVEGVHMGGVASRTAGGVLGSLRGSESKTSGISVEVGRTETAIDLKMGIEYNKNILQTVEEVRRRITDSIQSMTGLRVKELNATITDITFPEKEERRSIGSRSTTGERDASTDETATAQPTISGSEPDTGASERDTTQVEAASQAESETTPEETEVSAEDRPPEVEETAEVSSGDSGTEEQAAGETSEEAQTRAETETSEPAETSAEARRRRRAEERARRRRRTEDS